MNDIKQEEEKNSPKSQTIPETPNIEAVQENAPSVFSSTANLIEEKEAESNATNTNVEMEVDNLDSNTSMESAPPEQPVESIVAPDVNESTENLFEKKDEENEEDVRKVAARKRKRESFVFNVAERPVVSTDDENDDKKKDEKWKNWKRTAMMIWHKIADHKYGNVFMNSAKQEQIPGYTDIVKKPMSLLMIKNRIRDGEIRTTSEFFRDVLLVFTNAIMFNPEDSDLNRMAKEIKQSTEAEFRNLLSYDPEFLSRRRSIQEGSGEVNGIKTESN